MLHIFAKWHRPCWAIYVLYIHSTQCMVVLWLVSGMQSPVEVTCMLNTTTLAMACLACESELARSTVSLRMPHEAISAHCMLLCLQSCPSPLQYCSSSFHSHLPMHTPGGISRQFIQKWYYKKHTAYEHDVNTGLQNTAGLHSTSTHKHIEWQPPGRL